LSNIDLTFIADINGDHVVSNRDIQSMLDLAASAGSGDGSGANESESSMELAVTLPVNFVFSIVLPSMMPSPSTAAAVTDPVTAAASNPAKPTLFLPRGLTNLPSESGRKPMPNSQTSSLTADSPAPHPSKQLVAVVDRALSEWSMFRSWHLHWQNEKSPVDSTDDLLAEWK
jgi:hypothetical protein